MKENDGLIVEDIGSRDGIGVGKMDGEGLSNGEMVGNWMDGKHDGWYVSLLVGIHTGI